MATLTQNPYIVQADLNFLSPTLKEKPYYSRKLEHLPVTSNIVNDPVRTNLIDLRSLGSKEREGFTIDTSGFQIVNHESVEKEFLDEEKIKDGYYRESVEYVNISSPSIKSLTYAWLLCFRLIKSLTGANRVFIFDHTIRRRAHFESGPDSPENRGPGLRAHVDQSIKAGPERVRYHFPEEAEELLKNRVQVRKSATGFDICVTNFNSIRFADN